MNLTKRPVFAREQTAHSPSGPVSVPRTKVVFALSGWAEVHSQRGGVQLRQGSILTIPPDLRCHGYPVGHVRTVTLYFDPEYLDDQMRWLPIAHPLVHQLRRTMDERNELQRLQLGSEAIRQITPQLTNLARASSSALSNFALLSRASDVFDAVGRLSGVSTHGAGPTRSTPRPEILCAMELLRVNLSRPWTVGQLAHEVALSPSHLARLFQAQLGVSPAAYLRQIRADHMAELLATTSLSISEAGAAVGWQDPAFASRSFKQRYGVTPRTFAKTHREPS